MGLISNKLKSFYKSTLSVFILAVLVFSTLAPLAKVLADSSVPTSGTTGQYTVNPDGTIGLTLNGSWTWATHGNKDCNVDRYAVGWAVDWNDGSEPGNFVGTFNGHSYDTGVRTNVNGLNAIDNAVHYYSGPNPPRCGVLDPNLHYPVGNWGPISHTYPAGTTIITACVVTYDVHNDDHTADGIKAGDLVAGDSTSSTSGNTGNDDNSVEGNAPANSGCFAANIQNLVVVKHVDNTGGGTKSASDFKMNVNAVNPSQTSFPGSESGTTVQVGVGSYAVTENNDHDYIESASPSCTGSITAGQTIICTITNTYRGTLDICHATSSNSNPYVVNHPAKTGDVSGHDGHNGPIWFPGINVSWGDIIPPFDYVDNNGVTQHYSGKNWDATGQAVFNNGCSVNGTLTVNKVLNPSNDPGKFNLNIDNQIKASNVGNGGTTGAVSLTPGQHQVSETAGSNTNLSNYFASISGDCDTNGNVNLGVAQNLTCTITNSRLPSLTLNKTVANNNGGNKSASDFQGMIDSTNVPWFSMQTLSIGGHAASETNLPGYSASIWGGDCAADGSITLAAGQNAVCTITNSDIAPTLKVVKKVINNNGGTTTADKFDVTVNGTQLSGGILSNGNLTDTYTFPNAKANTDYTVSEDAMNGYNQTSLVCKDNDTWATISNPVTLNLAQNVTCTITNDDIAPTLKLVKNVINDNSGKNQPGDWTLTATGTNGFSDTGDSTTFHTVNAGVSYDLSESNVSGYFSRGWSCDGGSQSGSNITLGLDQNVTCTVTNDDIPNPAIQVVKSGPSVAHEGDKVTYTFDVTNVGDTQSLSNITVNDNLAGTASYVSGDTNGNSRLDKGEVWIYTADYVIPTPQIPDVTNTVTACGNFYSHQACDTDTHTLDVLHPAIKVVKYGPDTAFQGDKVTYSFYVTNTGDTELDNVGVADDLAIGEICDATVLAPDDSTWCHATYTIPGDQTGDVTNHVTASGTDQLDETVTAIDQHTLTVLVPGIHVVKTGPSNAAAGSTVTYTFTVTNTGNIPLTDLTVNDNIAGAGTYQSGDTNNNNMLDTSETWIYTAQYTIPANQFNSVNNTVTACGSTKPQEVDLELDTQQINSTKTVCAEASHTLVIPKVLAESTPPKLVNTGQDAITEILAGVLVLSLVGAVNFATARKR